jgi:hypothetical protein
LPNALSKIGAISVLSRSFAQNLLFKNKKPDGASASRQ